MSTFRPPDINFPLVCCLDLKISSLWKMVAVAALVSSVSKALVSLKDYIGFVLDLELG